MQIGLLSKPGQSSFYQHPSPVILLGSCAWWGLLSFSDEEGESALALVFSETNSGGLSLDMFL